MKNLKQALRNGEPIIGVIIASGSPAMVEIAGYAGYDFVYIDCEHGVTSPFGREFQEMVRAAEAADITAITRIISNDVSQVRKVLDSGAKGVVVPFLNTAEDAQKLVANCLYPPEGNRGAAPGVRAPQYGAMDWYEFMKKSNDEILAVGILERQQGMANLEAICSVKGLTAVFTGFFDFGLELALPEKDAAAVIDQARTRVISTASKKGVFVGDVALTPQMVPSLVRQGVRIILTPADTSLFLGVAKQFLEESRTLLKKVKIK
jgi:4-hydroxy-2-oxoheptanedioate aldolase